MCPKSQALFFILAALFTRIINYYALLVVRSCRFKVQVLPCLPVELISLSVHTCILAAFCWDVPNTTHIRLMIQPVTIYCWHIPLSAQLICTEYTYLSLCLGGVADDSEISANNYTPLSMEYNHTNMDYAWIQPSWNETTLRLPTFLLRFEGKPCIKRDWHRRYITRGTVARGWPKTIGIKLLYSGFVQDCFKQSNIFDFDSKTIVYSFFSEFFPKES